VMTVVRVQYLHFSLHETTLVTCQWSVETYPPNKMQSFSPALLEHVAPQ
jgi:hypothetical protein